MRKGKWVEGGGEMAEARGGGRGDGRVLGGERKRARDGIGMGKERDVRRRAQEVRPRVES